MTHTNEYPWTWLAHHFEEFLAELRTGEPPLKVSTLRSYTTAIRTFTSYVSDEEHVHNPDMPARHRAIAILLLIFGQPLERFLALTWDDVNIADAPVTIRLGETADIELHPGSRSRSSIRF